MADHHSIWDRAVRMFIGETMRRKLAVLVVTDDAIAAMVNRASPRPAGIWLAGFVELEEPFADRPASVSVGARAGAEPLTFPGDTTQFAVSTEWTVSYTHLTLPTS